MRRPILAVDFDGTIVEHKFPDIGEPIYGALQCLRQMQKEGVILILWTCRQREHLREAVAWCEAQGIVFDAVNADCEQTLSWWADKYDGTNYKVYADRYIDDRHVGTKICGATWLRTLQEMRALAKEFEADSTA